MIEIKHKKTEDEIAQESEDRAALDTLKEYMDASNDHILKKWRDKVKHKKEE